MSSADHLFELESLRSQVRALSRKLAERDQAMKEQDHHHEQMRQDLREQSQRLRAIVEGTAAETGEEFFASLVNHLTTTLQVQYAVIGEVFEVRARPKNSKPVRSRTEAPWSITSNMSLPIHPARQHSQGPSTCLKRVPRERLLSFSC